MREICHDIERWLREDKEVALAQVVRTWGSSPRVAGSTMAVNNAMAMAGSVSGGCVEGSVVQSAFDSFDQGYGKTEEFHASMQKAHDVGLSCGGDIDVAISLIDVDLFRIEFDEIRANRGYTRVTLIDAPDKESIGSYFLIVEEAERCSDVFSESCGEGKVLHLNSDSRQKGFIEKEAVRCVAASIVAFPESQVTGCVHWQGYVFFYNRIKPPLELICIGGVHISMHVARIAKLLGYRTTVVDPRGIFTGDDRFGFVDELAAEWPQEFLARHPLHEASALCALTHDPKIDIPALAAALDSPAFYIGSLGRTTTQRSRYMELAELGFSDEEIGRISGPIGIDVGGKEPAEIALSIMTEITRVKHGKSFQKSSMVDSARRAAHEECVV